MEMRDENEVEEDDDGKVESVVFNLYLIRQETHISLQTPAWTISNTGSKSDRKIS